MKPTEIGKVTGLTKIYDPETQTVREIEMEAAIKFYILEPRMAEKWFKYYYRPFLVELWAESECPYDGEELRFSIVWADTASLVGREGGDIAFGCIHFDPVYTGEVDTPEAYEVEKSMLFVKETLKEFTKKIGWKARLREIFGGNYYVFSQVKAFSKVFNKIIKTRKAG